MRAFVLLAALALAGCAVGPLQVDPEHEKAEAVLDFTLADVRAARASAERWGDPKYARCWATLEDWLANLPEFTTVIGGATAVQKARNVRRILEQRDEEVTAACAPIVMDAQTTVGRLRSLAIGAGLPF